MVKVASMLAFRTPNYSLCNSLSPVDSFLGLHFSSSIKRKHCIRKSDTSKSSTSAALSCIKCNALFETCCPQRNNGIPSIQAALSQCLSFRKSRVYLWGLTICAVKSKGFGKILSFPLNLNRKAFLSKTCLEIPPSALSSSHSQT